MRKYSFKELGLENTRDMFKRANEMAILYQHLILQIWNSFRQY